MGEFMQFMASPAGIAIFVVVALALVILILALNYRFFCQSVTGFFVRTYISYSALAALCGMCRDNQEEGRHGFAEPMDSGQGRQARQRARVLRL